MGGRIGRARATMLGVVLGLAVVFPAYALPPDERAPAWTQLEPVSTASAPTTDGETTSPSRPTPKPVPTWYGWQILLADAASGTLMGAGVGANSAVGFYVGLGTYMLLDGTIVHLAHGHGDRALRSLGLRAGLSIGTGLVGAVVGAVVAVAQNGQSSGGCGPCLEAAEFGGAGFASGLFVATILDVALLAFEEPPVPSPAQPVSLQLHLAPIAGLPRDATGRTVPTFGITGSF
jgi:hypothetical protein